MDNNSLTIGFGQTQTDYFGNGQSQIKPTSQMINYSRELNDAWIVEFSYEKIQADGRWLNRDGVAVDLFDRAESDSKTFGIALGWQAEDYGLTLSYADIKTNDKSLTFLPRIVETVDSDDKIISFSFNKSIEFSSTQKDYQWGLDWFLGAQYAQFDVSIFDNINTEPPTNVNTFIEQSSWSSFVDVSVNYWIEDISFAWAPYLSLSWNWELSSTGEQLILISRGDLHQVIDEPSGRFSTSFRIPDSGTWEVGVDFLWINGWSINLRYGQTLETEFDLDSIAIDISVAF